MKQQRTSALFAAAGRSGREGGGDQTHRPLVPEIPRMQFPRGKGDKHYTSWLVVRYAAGDDGSRPLPGGSVFWESPDVWVVSSLGINQPVPGEPNTVFARVSNFGLQDATGVSVKFWWANPSLAITEANAHLIGIGSANIVAGASAVVECPDKWVPVVENNGHECLLAEAFIPGFDPLVAPMDPTNDRHVGQKNEQLVMLQQGMKFSVQLQAVNIASFTQQLTFEVQALRLDAVPALITARQVLAKTDVPAIVPAESALPVILEVADSPAFFTGPSALFARRLVARTEQELAGLAHDCFVPAQISRHARFEPWEARNLVIHGQVPPGTRRGELFTFRAVQLAGRMVVGGYTVHVLVV